MSDKPKDANSIPEKRKVTFEDERFFNGILNDEYILVVGSGIILNRKEYPETKGDINVFFLNAINKEKHTNFDSLSDAVSAYPLEISPLYSVLAKDVEYDIDKNMAPELIDLLKTKYFRYVFTTTPDHYVETLMKGIWDNDLKVVNFSNENSVRNFFDAINESKGSYDRPTLFYVFGKMIKGQKNPTKFLETDSDAISYIEEWIKIINEKKPLVTFLKKKRIFSIGCNFDDWYHRFFWHILTCNFAREGDCYYNDNAVLKDKTGKLEEYLSLKNVCVHSEPWAVIAHLNHMLTADKGDAKFTDLVKRKTLEGRVFMSYKTDPDKDLAQNVFDSLSRQASFNIWFDSSNLLGGQPYNERIPMAIKFSQIFVPVLTSSIAKKLNEFTIEDLRNLDVYTGLPFFIQEWIWASAVDDMVIIPISFDGYDLKGPEHVKFESIIYGDDVSSRPSGIYMGSADKIDHRSIEKLISSINNTLGINE